MFNFFKKKPKECFFCKEILKSEETFKLQFSSSEGLHTVDMCDPCAKVFDGFSETMEELRNNG
jgi:RNase P subunit RPR2